MIEEILNDCISDLPDILNDMLDFVYENRPRVIFRKIRNGKKYKKRYLIFYNPISDLICSQLSFSMKLLKRLSKGENIRF